MRIPYIFARCVQHKPQRQSANQSNEANPWPKISLTGGGEDDRGLLGLRCRDATVLVGRDAGNVYKEDVDQVRDGEEAHGCLCLA